MRYAPLGIRLFSLLNTGKEDFFMQKRTKCGIITSVRALTLAAMLCAMSVVIGIFCKNFMNFGAGLFRITFENLPVIISGIIFGPAVGGAVGGASDLISYLLSSQAYPPNLIVTLGAVMIGVTSGVISKYVIRHTSDRQIILAGASAHIIGSMLIKTIGLYSYYGMLVLWRIPLYLIISSAEILLICLLFKNTAVRKLVDSAKEIK